MHLERTSEAYLIKITANRYTGRVKERVNDRVRELTSERDILIDESAGMFWDYSVQYVGGSV